MHTLKIITATLGILLSAQCGDKDSNNQTPNDPPSQIDTLPPVETQPPNTTYTPAYSGQTRAPGMKTTTEYTATAIATGLSNPWGIVSMPDGRLLISEKTGTLRIASETGTLSGKITGLPMVNSTGQGGLLDIALSPSYNSDRMIYFVYAESVSGGTTTAVGKGRLSADETKLEAVTNIYRVTPAWNSTLHYGGRILFDSDGYLIVSTGERSNADARPLAQLLDNGLGKIIKIKTDGSPAPGLPFANTPNALQEIFSYGHRNTQSIAIHPTTGALWQAEFGPLGGDELNLITPGKNYGWPVITYGLEYSGAKIAAGITQQAGMEQPVYYWDPVISPSGMIIYQSDAIPEWKHNIFIACLSGRHIVRLSIKDNKVKAEERLLSDKGERFRDLAEGADGSLYAVTDGGKLFKIQKK